jgi:hypothetical protein
VLDRRDEGGARHLAECRCREHVAPPTAPALDRAAIDANDQSEPSSRDPVTSARSGGGVSRLPVVEDTFWRHFPISNRYNATTAVPQGLPALFQSATWSPV